MISINTKIICLLSTVMCLNSMSQIQYPQTKTVNQTDTYFGQSIQDPYRWLEDDNSAETKEWVGAQNSLTQSYLQKITYKDKIKSRLTELWNFDKKSVPFKKGSLFFSFVNNGLQNQSVFCYQKSLQDEPIVLLDPNLFSSDGTTSLNTISISKDAKYLAYGISKAGSDWVEIHTMEIATKQELPEIIKWVKFSNVAWKGNGFYYSRYAEPLKDKAFTQKNEFHKVYYHQVGTNQQQDVLVYEDLDNAERNFTAQVSHDENYLIIYGSETTSGQSLSIKDLSNAQNPFIKIITNFDNEYQVVENVGKQFYVFTKRYSECFIKIFKNKHS